jgi:hypothetical protein
VSWYPEDWTEEEIAAAKADAEAVASGAYGRCVRCLEPKPDPGADDLCACCKADIDQKLKSAAPRGQVASFGDLRHVNAWHGVIRSDGSGWSGPLK